MDQEQVITTLEGMTVLELNALVKQLEERWGVSAAAPMGGAQAPDDRAGDDAHPPQDKEERGGQRIRARRGARAARSAATSPRRRSSSPRPSSSSTGPLGARCGPCSDRDIAAPRSTGQPGLPLIPRHGLTHNE
jgi:hypothetical protein